MDLANQPAPLPGAAAAAAPEVLGSEVSVPEVSVPEVSVIVVNWNTRDLLRDCLRAVGAETRARHEIIVVDNASSDGSAAMVGAEFPDVVLIANDGNRGFAAANNQGLRLARGRYLLLLNPDTVVLDGAIDRMLGWLVAHPDTGCAGCQVWQDAATIQRTCFADPGPLNLLITELGLGRLGRWLPLFGRPWYSCWDRRSERAVDVVSGMFMLVPRAVLGRVGLLDEAFFVYAEEADWCRRIRQAGWRCMFTPAARILHRDGGGKSTAQIRPRMHVQLQKSHLIYARKHHGRAGHAAVKALFLGSALLRLGFFGLLRAVRADAATAARLRLHAAALTYHLAGREPVA